MQRLHAEVDAAVAAAHSAHADAEAASRRQEVVGAQLRDQDAAAREEAGEMRERTEEVRAAMHALYAWLCASQAARLRCAQTHACIRTEQEKGSWPCMHYMRACIRQLGTQWLTCTQCTGGSKRQSDQTHTFRNP